MNDPDTWRCACVDDHWSGEHLALSFRHLHMTQQYLRLHNTPCRGVHVCARVYACVCVYVCVPSTNCTPQLSACRPGSLCDTCADGWTDDCYIVDYCHTLDHECDHGTCVNDPSSASYTCDCEADVIENATRDFSYGFVISQ